MNRIIITLFLSATLTAAFSQGFDGGLLGGLAGTQVDGDGYGGYDKLGFIGGVWVNRPLTNNYHLEFQIRYIQKGSYWDRKQDGIRVEFYRLKLNYMEVPTLISREIKDDIFIVGGITAGYLWSVSEKREGEYRAWEDEKNFRRIEMSAKIGGEYQFHSSWSVSAFFSYSLYPIRPFTVYSDWRRRMGQTNNVLELYLKYMF